MKRRRWLIAWLVLIFALGIEQFFATNWADTYDWVLTDRGDTCARRAEPRVGNFVFVDVRRTTLQRWPPGIQCRTYECRPQRVGTADTPNCAAGRLNSERFFVAASARAWLILVAISIAIATGLIAVALVLRWLFRALEPRSAA
jgi:hypothetical protein